MGQIETIDEVTDRQLMELILERLDIALEAIVRIDGELDVLRKHSLFKAFRGKQT
jgi:hypothetical protein